MEYAVENIFSSNELLFLFYLGHSFSLYPFGNDNWELFNKFGDLEFQKIWKYFFGIQHRHEHRSTYNNEVLRFF